MKLIHSRSDMTEKKRRSVLGKTNDGPGSGPQCRARGFCFPNMHKTLLQEPSRIRRIKLLEVNVLIRKLIRQNMRRCDLKQTRNRY